MIEFGAGGNIVHNDSETTAPGADAAPSEATPTEGNAEGTADSPTPPAEGAPAPTTPTPTVPANPRRKRKAKGWFCPVCRQRKCHLSHLPTLPHVLNVNGIQRILRCCASPPRRRRRTRRTTIAIRPRATNTFLLSLLPPSLRLPFLRRSLRPTVVDLPLSRGWASCVPLAVKAHRSRTSSVAQLLPWAQRKASVSVLGVGSTVGYT